MKKKLFVVPLLILSVLVLSNDKAFAATYDDATKAKSNGNIEFETGGPEIVDPEDPKVIIDPVNPNENKGDLVLQYVSNFDFGIHERTSQYFETLALPDRLKNSELVVPFVSTKDLRTNRQGGWELSVTSGKFKSVTDGTYVGGQELNGAEIVLTNAVYNGPESSDLKPEVAQKAKETNVSQGLALTPGSPVVVARAIEDETSNKKQGIGSYSLALGKVTDINGKKLTSGVTFRKPEKLNVDEAQYVAILEWELTPGIK